MGSGEEKVENPQTTVEGSEGDDVEGNDETTETVLTEETTEANNDEINVEEKDEDVHESDSDDNLEGSGEEKMENPQTTTKGALGCKADADCEKGKKCSLKQNGLRSGKFKKLTKNNQKAYASPP